VRTVSAGVPVDEVIAAVKAAVKQANLSRGTAGRDIKVVGLDLTLNTVTQRTGGGGLDFRVPVIGMRIGGNVKLTSKDTQTLEMALVPPDDGDEFEIRGGGIERALVDAVATIRSVVATASAGPDPFALKHAVLTLEFAVTDAGSITFVGQGELSDEVTHTLKLSLAPAR
jgi:Trypsin-co-occurring domain 2